MLAEFVPENAQSMIEGFRNALFKVAVFFGGLSVALPVNYLSQTMFATAIITCVLTRSLPKGFQKQDFSCI